MGIYSNGIIYGIRIYTFNDDDLSYILFEKKYDVILSDDQKKEAYLFYTELETKNVFFQIYTECSTTYGLQHNQNRFMMWEPITLDMFLEKFRI